MSPYKGGTDYCLKKSTMNQKVYLDGISARHQSITNKIKELAESLSEDQLNFKPSAKSWSIAEVLEHLTTANSTYFPGIKKLLESDDRGTPSEDYKTNLAARFLIWSLKPNGPKMPSPGVFIPAKSELGKDSLTRYMKNCEEISDFMKQGAAYNLVKLKMSSPAASFARFNLGGVFDIFVTHAERHYEQMKRVKAATGFPV